jgi:hypothetical protein
MIVLPFGASPSPAFADRDENIDSAAPAASVVKFLRDKPLSLSALFLFMGV